MDREVILVDGFGITASELVPLGTVAIILKSGEVKVVPAEHLRATIEQLGSDKVEGVSMAPSEFERVRLVLDRREKQKTGKEKDS
ncbi:hypothetical protein LMIY3S_00223 [Labrys miyagiensis]